LLWSAGEILNHNQIRVHDGAILMKLCIWHHCTWAESLPWWDCSLLRVADLPTVWDNRDDTVQHWNVCIHSSWFTCLVHVVGKAFCEVLHVGSQGRTTAQVFFRVWTPLSIKYEYSAVIDLW
jgi:hypothetical protein